MACFYPLNAYRTDVPNENGKRPLTWDANKGYERVQVRCGQCSGCREDHARFWAVRCMHEASLYEDNIFLTLTYDEEHVPYSLDVSHFQGFVRELRRKFPEKKIRYFHCGEYGKELNRPHYHAILFNFDFPDSQHFYTNKDINVCRSPILEDIWYRGYSTFSSVNFDAIAYVTSYVHKKITGDMAPDWYQGRRPEYVTMSRNPGIASDWISQFPSDVYPHDSVSVIGRKGLFKLRPPRYYDEKFHLTDPDKYAKLKERRMQVALSNPHNSPERLRVRDYIKKKKQKQKERSYEA